MGRRCEIPESCEGGVIGTVLRITLATSVAIALATGPACRSIEAAAGRQQAPAGNLLAAGTSVRVSCPVTGPRDPGGFDGATERCVFAPERVLPSAPAAGCDQPRRYGERATAGLAPGTAASVAARGWDLDSLRERIDQVVLHYDACGTSHRCFQVLHDERGLSCHFLLDVDGTLRQTLDLSLRARHATTSNDRSIGIEIAHAGAFATEAPFAATYRRGARGLEVTPPARLHPPPGAPFAVARDGYFRGAVNGKSLVQPDFTEAQYRTLERLLPELCRVFPRVGRRVPAAQDALGPAALAQFRGVLGHQHVQSDKTDPGPAFDWARIARCLGR